MHCSKRKALLKEHTHTVSKPRHCFNTNALFWL